MCIVRGVCLPAATLVQHQNNAARTVIPHYLLLPTSPVTLTQSQLRVSLQLAATMFNSPPRSRCSSDPNLTSDISSVPGVKILRKRKQPEHDMQTAFEKLAEDIKVWKIDISCKLDKLDERFNTVETELSNIKLNVREIKDDLTSLKMEQQLMDKRVTALEANQTSILEEISSLKTSSQFHHDQQVTASTSITQLETQAKTCDQAKILITTLETKIDSLEQQARQCNIEITNVPERKSENLLSLVLAVGSAVGCTVLQSDILSVHRVPHAQPGVSKPKNIIVKFASRILRDNLLSSFRLAKGLKTDQLGVHGTPQAVYLNEHLTLRNKILFRETREAAKRNGFRYVWVRHATILVRESDSSAIFAVRSHGDLSRIKPRGKPDSSNARSS